MLSYVYNYWFNNPSAVCEYTFHNVGSIEVLGHALR